MPNIPNTKNASPALLNREIYFKANSDLVQTQILLNTGQELVQYPQDSIVRVWYNDLTRDYDPHWHTALEIIVPIENWYDITIDGKTYHAMPGDIFMIPPGEMHSLKAPESGSRFVFLFDLSFLSKLQGFASIQALLSQPQHLTRSTSSGIYEDAYNILLQIQNTYFTKSEFAELTICSLLLQLFIKLGTNHFENIDLFTNIRVYKQKEYIQKFNSVMDYIDSHYTEELNLEDIARSIGFSKYHFSRLFKQYTGYTFCAYICHRRIKVAEDLLEQPDLSITEVALQSGFPSISTFNRLFKQQKDCTPSEYREKNRAFIRSIS